MGDRLALLADPAVRSALAASLGYDVELHASIASTQDRTRALADAGSGPVVVIADEQTAGHGRQGRPWIAPCGAALLASWLVRPVPADPALFALLSGVAVARALASLGVAGARLKWPNDVQLGGKKVAGALADATTGPGGGALILGIGVNVHQSAADLGDLGGIATSLAREGHLVDRLGLLARLCAELDRIARSPEERRAALAEWRSRASMLGLVVEVRSAGAATLRGVARELADDGALVLSTPTGDQRILAGEVSLLT